MKTKRERAEYGIQAVANAMKILELFQDGIEERRLAEFIRVLDLSKNCAFRLLATLESLDYLELNKETGGYRLGFKNLELGQTVKRQMGLLKQSRPLLEALVGQCNETANLVILKGCDVFNLDGIESGQVVRVLPRVGQNLPSYCTASGKLLLALAGDEERLRLIAQAEFTKYTARTITNRHALTRSLEKIAAQGYAVVDEELDPGVRGIAAPIRDYRRRVLGAISLFGPVGRFGEERMRDELVPGLLIAADAISERLGYAPAQLLDKRA